MNNVYICLIIVLLIVFIFVYTKLLGDLLHELSHRYERIGIITLIVFYISLGIMGIIEMIKSIELNG